MIYFFDRLDKFMEYKGLNDNKLTVEVGISNGLIGKARKRGSLSPDNISKILYTYPELDANWLFLDEGEMLKSNKIHSSVADLPTEYKKPDKSQMQIIEELQKQNHDQRNDIEWFKKELDKKQEMIDALLSGSVCVKKM